MAAYRPLQRPTPHLHQSGAIKFRVVLSMARAQRAIRQRLATAGRFPAMARLEAVRDDMVSVRRKIIDDRAFWSVTNVPTIEYERVRVEHFGHVWFEAQPVAAKPVVARRAA